MHSLILRRLEATPGAIPARISSGRGSIVCVFDSRAGAPLWVAKSARGAEAAGRLRLEYEALAHLAPWARALGIPEVLEWSDSPGECVLIQTGVSGKREVIALPLDAPEAELRRRFGDVMTWVEKFERLVPLPVPVALGELFRQFAEQLGSRPELSLPAAGLLDILRNPGPAGERAAVPVHGDLHQSNVLFLRPGLTVVDWCSFGPGFPFANLFSYLVNSDYHADSGICSLIEAYRHVFFSDSPVCRLVRQRIDADGCGPEAARSLFYGFLATQICADATTPVSSWLAVLAYLESHQYPSPCTPLPKPPRMAIR